MSNGVSFEIVNFEKEMRRVREEVKSLANDDIADQISYAKNTLKIVTPVDTGKARSGWKSKTYTGFDGYTEGILSNLSLIHISEPTRPY